MDFQSQKNTKILSNEAQGPWFGYTQSTDLISKIIDLAVQV